MLWTLARSRRSSTASASAKEILKIFEKYCGARLTTHAFRIGGLQYEAHDTFEKDVERFCKDFESRIVEYETLLTQNRIWIGRTKGVGILTAADAIAFGVTGPVLRASGVKWDIRKAMPLRGVRINTNSKFPSAQRETPTIATCPHGRDAAIAADLPASHRKYSHRAIMAKVGKVLKPPPGEVYHAIEAPKGEIGYYVVSDGTVMPVSRAHSAAFLHYLQAFDRMVRGHLVARCGSHHWNHRHRPRRSGPMMQILLQATIEFLKAFWAPLLCGVAIVAILPLIVGYIVLVERKLMADMQARLGPMRVGPHGLLQPIADAVKLLIKETSFRTMPDRLVFWLAPVLSVGAALLSLAGLAIGPAFQIAQDINIGILFVVGVSALGIFGIVLGGWASNSHYSLMGALRSSAAVGELRDRRGHGAGQRAFIYWHAKYQINRRSAEQRRYLVCAARAGGLLLLSRRFHCRDQPRPIRSAGS